MYDEGTSDNRTNRFCLETHHPKLGKDLLQVQNTFIA
jgi:hypothetical protein